MQTGLPATMGRCAGGSLPERIASSYILASDTPSLAAACKQGVDRVWTWCGQGVTGCDQVRKSGGGVRHTSAQSNGVWHMRTGALASPWADIHNYVRASR